MTLERSRSEELLEPQVIGLEPLGAISMDPLTPGPSMFLLDPGGQDYVGNNSYDDTARMDE